MTRRVNVFGLCALLGLTGLLSLAGCAAFPIRFDVKAEGTTTIQKGTLLEQLTGGLGFDSFSSFDISESQEFKNQNTNKNLIKEAKLKSITMTITGPDSQNFDFLEELSFFVEAPGQTRKRIATKTVPRGVKTFSLDLDNVDLTPYVKAESLKITTEAKGKRPENDTTIKAEVVITIGAGVL